MLYLGVSTFVFQYSYNDVGHEKTDLKVFWYDTDFSEFDPDDIIDYIDEKQVSYQKKDGMATRTHTSFDMTKTILQYIYRLLQRQRP